MMTAQNTNSLVFFFLYLLLPLRSIRKQMKDTKQQFEHVIIISVSFCLDRRKL